VAKDRDDKDRPERGDRGGRQQQNAQPGGGGNPPPSSRGNDGPRPSRGNDGPKFNPGGNTNNQPRGGRSDNNPPRNFGNGGSNPAPRRIDIPRTPVGNNNPGNIPPNQTRARGQNNDQGNNRGGPPVLKRRDNDNQPNIGGGNNPGNPGGGPPVLKRRDNENRPKGGVQPNPGVNPPANPGGNPIPRRRDNDNKPGGPNLGGNNPGIPGNNPPVLKRRDNENKPGGPNVGGNNNNPGNPPVLKRRDNDNKPGGPNVGGNNPGNPGSNPPVLKRRDNDNKPGGPNVGGNNNNSGNPPVLKRRDNDNKPGGPNIGGNNNNPGNPGGRDKPDLRPRDRDNTPGNNLPNLGDNDRGRGDRDRGDRDNDGPRGGNRNPEINDSLKKFRPDTAKRERNEKDLLRNKDQIENYLSRNPELRNKLQTRDGKVDFARLHLERDHKDRIPTVIQKNGRLNRDFDDDRDVADRFRHNRKFKDVDELDRQLNHFRDPDVIRRHPEFARINFNNVSGRFQHRLAHQNYDGFVGTRVGRQLRLNDQFNLYRRGDVARQLNLNIALVNGGGWRNRYVGPVYGGFAAASFSSWYAGPGFYPRYCWTPTWSPWVDWSWWNNCPPIYDPRPIVCRPYFYDPCPTWVVYEYPTWQSLPVVASGTWVDLPPPVLVEQPDVQLVAVRFIDAGHLEQNLGTRYRVWLQNNSNVAINGAFNVLLLAGNTANPTADLPQAGVTVPSMEPGEMQVVDIRLPFEANKMNRVDNHLTPFEYLHVLVDSHRQLQDPTPENNGAVLARTDILPVDPAAFAPDVSAAAPGAMVSIAGEGFGPEPGRLIVSINGEETEATIYGWYDLGVQFELPNVDVTGPTDAEVLIVRGDGAAANPVNVRIAAENQLSEAILVPAPLP